jgi:superfamily II DNA or RNA helicase
MTPSLWNKMTPYMQSHGPKRVYNLVALESWFNRLTSSWEPFFSGASVERGRQLYRDGMIREIELGEKDAIIHSKIDGKECYAVIEWEARRPSTRASTDEQALGEALAIAGLYEIEEMVVDEISAIPAEAEQERRAPANLQEVLTEVKKQEPAGRALLLEFTVSVQGLLYSASWRGEDGSTAPALMHGGNGQLLASEREKLIRLASLSRKYHFHFVAETQQYLLDDTTRIQAFLKTELAAWRKFFDVKLDLAVERLTQGVRQIEVEAKARARGDGGLDLAWIFRAGQVLLSEVEVAALLARKDGGAVLLPSLGFVELTREKHQAVREWKKRLEPSSGPGPNYLLVSLFADRRLKIEVDEEVEQWRCRLMEEPQVLPSLPDYLRNYQKRGVQWMAHLCDLGCHGLLADEMGLGKTVQMISLLAARPTAETRHLIVAPASVIPVWQKEWARFWPQMPIHVLKSGANFNAAGGDGVWLASYTQVRRHAHLLGEARFGYAVLDEGQWIKNPEAKITRCCFSIQARHRIILTGTPLENRQLDLWSLFEFLMPGLLGNRASFEASILENREAFLKKLRAQVAPFVLRRTKKLVASELPQKVEMTLAAPLSVRQREEYGRICEDGLSRLGDSLSETIRERSFGLFSLLTRLRQACCDPGLLPWANDPWEESGKIALLLEKLSDLVAGGHKVVVFSQFVAFLKRVGQALDREFPDLARFQLTGSSLDRQTPVEQFQQHTGAAVMLISLKAGGTGITLHAADYVFLLDPWWNPAVEDQAIDRVHRIGQTNTVFVYRIIAAGTVEERIQDLQEKKRDLFQAVIGGMPGAGSVREHFASLRQLIELESESGSGE